MTFPRSPSVHPGWHPRLGTAIVTTPKIEYDVRLDGLLIARFRRKERRFERARGRHQGRVVSAQRTLPTNWDRGT